MNVRELTGVQLDFWVARALGYQTDLAKIRPGGDWCAIELRGPTSVAPPDFGTNPADTACAIAMVPNALHEFPACILGQKIGRGKYPVRSSWFYPSTLWSHGGPIIDQARPELIPCWPAGGWYARSPHLPCDGDQYYGETALLAAMRAFVASKFGETVVEQPIFGAPS